MKTLKVVAAPDSFKGSLSSTRAARAMEEGVRRCAPDARVVRVPIADGGEGTVDAFLSAAGGRKISATVTGPLGDRVRSFYGRLGDGTAVVEMAAASGFGLAGEKPDPLRATSRGTGELIRAALAGGSRRVIVGLGGSATNDGGMGALEALGVVFRDGQGKALPGCGESLERIACIDCGARVPELRNTRVFLACDVSNPLCGESGASFVFGPQKGADPETVKRLDKGLSRFARIAEQATGRDIRSLPGAGAAGGMGGGFAAFLDAKMEPGFSLIAKAARLEEKIRDADFILTGEGAADGQTAMGKVPAGIGSLAKPFHVPVFVLSGSARGADALYQMGITALLSIADGPTTLSRSCERAGELLAACAGNVTRIFLSARK